MSKALCPAVAAALLASHQNPLQHWAAAARVQPCCPVIGAGTQPLGYPICQKDRLRQLSHGLSGYPIFGAAVPDQGQRVPTG